MPQQKCFNALAVRIKQQWNWHTATDHMYVLSYISPDPRFNMVEDCHLIDVTTLLPDDNHFTELNEPEDLEEEDDDFMDFASIIGLRPTSVIVPDCRTMSLRLPNL